MAEKLRAHEQTKRQKLLRELEEEWLIRTNEEKEELNRQLNELLEKMRQLNEEEMERLKYMEDLEKLQKRMQNYKTGT